MTVSIYVDGSGSPRGGYGWFVKETGQSHYASHDDITNNQAEYMAVISAIRHVASSVQMPCDDDIVVYSDSLNTVRQLNHEYAINNRRLRELAMQAWSEIAKLGDDARISVVWVRRENNLAGKMLGS